MSVREPSATVDSLPPRLQRALQAAHDKKAFDVVVLSLDASEAFTDYVVLCSARSSRQVRAVVDEIQQQLKRVDSTPSHVEGYEHGEWVLMDFFEFVVHVFTPDKRRFYDLERLWGNATRIPIPEPG